MVKKEKTIQKMFDLHGRTALITGGAGLLALRHARALLEAGAKIALADINGPALGKTVALLRKEFPRKVFGFILDITDERQISRVLARAEREAGDISILINNAAHNVPVKRGDTKGFSRLERFSVEAWEKDIAVGLTGAFLMSREVGRRMARRGSGVILNIASDLGVIAPDQRIYRQAGLKRSQQPVKPVTYSVVKHGIIGLTKYLATYWAEDGVRVNSLSPAGVQEANPPEDFVAKLRELIPVGRMARAEEYKGAVLFLCSDASSYMTGANLIVDGGRTCW